MSQYTKVDPDVIFLDTPDRVNYEFDLLNHDVNTFKELSFGVTAAKNPKDIKNYFKNWKTAGTGILVLLIFIVTILLLVSILIYLFLYIKKIEWKVSLLRKIGICILFFFVLVCTLYYIFNKLLTEIMALITLSRE